MNVERREALDHLDAMEHTLAEQVAAEIAAAAAFDQASTHLAQVHGRVVAANQQVHKARIAVMQAFNLPGADIFGMLQNVTDEVLK